MKRISMAVLLLLIAVFPLTVSAATQKGLPTPDWITPRTNADSSVTVTISSPPYMIDDIDYYEYSTDGFRTYKTLSNTAGGEFVITETCDFSIRYYYNSICSPVYTLPVVISRSTIVSCQSTGISIVIPDGSSIPTDITVTAFEIINGADYSAVKEGLPGNTGFRMFAVNVLKDGKAFTSEESFSYLFPADSYDAEKCRMYFMDDEKNIRLIDSKAEEDSVSFSSAETGIYIIVQTNEYKKGDINNDGKVQANDARYALRIASQLEKCSKEQLSAGDINKNGKIDASDARKILRFAASLDII